MHGLGHISVGCDIIWRVAPEQPDEKSCVGQLFRTVLPPSSKHAIGVVQSAKEVCHDHCVALQVSETLLEQVYDCFHLTDFMGSDHCPVGLVLRH